MSMRNVKLLRLHTVLWSALFIIPVIVPYYEDEIGLSFREFMIGEALFCAVMVAMEVPSGWISDVWTRRRTMMVASAAFAAGQAMLLFATGFGGTLAAQAAMGVGVSLLSGTNSALLYDTLLADGREAEYRREEGFRHGLGLYTVGTASMSAGFLYGIHHDLPLILSISGSVLAVLAAALMREPARHREPVQHHPLADMLKTMDYALRGHRDIAGIVLLAGSVFGITKVMLWMQQPYFMMLDLPVAWFGVLTALGCIAGGAGGHFGHLADGRMRDTTVLLVCAGAVFCAFMIAGIWPGYHAIPLIMSGSLLYGFGWPRVQNAINRRVSSARRATILSTASLMVNLTAIPFFILAGTMTARAGVTDTLQLMAAVILGGAISGFVLTRISVSAKIK